MLEHYQEAAVTRVLDAAGVERVTAAMTGVCVKGYENKGWRNCFFTQMFGGPDGLKAIAAKHDEHFADIDNYDSYPIAKELDVEPFDVDDVIAIFDEPGQVRSLLCCVDKWLQGQGVTLVWDTDWTKAPATV